MSPATDDLVMCLWCGVMVPIEVAAEQRHTCRPVGSLGPYLHPSWRPVRLVVEFGKQQGKTWRSGE